MNKGTYSTLGFVMMAIIALFFVRGTLILFRHSLAKAYRLRLHAPDGDPSLHVEALFRVVNPFAFYAKRKELAAFLEDHAVKKNCANAYGLLMDAVVKATTAYHALPASDDNADIVLGALHISQGVETALKERFDAQLLPFGVQIGGLCKCALGTRPPVVVPTP